MCLWMKASVKTRPREKLNQRYPTLPPPTLKRYLNNQGCQKIQNVIVSVECGGFGGLGQCVQEGLPYVWLLITTIQGHCFEGVGEPLLQDFPGRVRFYNY